MRRMIPKDVRDMPANSGQRKDQVLAVAFKLLVKSIHENVKSIARVSGNVARSIVDLASA